MTGCSDQDFGNFAENVQLEHVEDNINLNFRNEYDIVRQIELLEREGGGLPR
jgi:hypothetical protein